MIQLTEENFNKEVVEYKGKVIIDVWANWCGKCKMFKPKFEEMAKQSVDNKFCTMDADVNQNLCNQLNISNLPTILVYENGKLITQGGFEILEMF